MKREKNRKNAYRGLYGIQKKLLLYMMVLVTLALVLITIGINDVVSRNITENITEQYHYVNDKFYSAFEELYSKLNVVTENCIANVNVQNSLKNKELGSYEKDIISRTLEFMGEDYMDYYVYIDNKNNVYSLRDVKEGVRRLPESYLYEGLGNEYSKLKLFWEPDIFTGSQENAFFAGRYVRQFERSYAPGYVYLKLEDSVFENMLSEVENTMATFFVLDNREQICYENDFGNFEQSEKYKTNVRQQIVNLEGWQEDSLQTTLSEGLAFGQKHGETGFTIVTFVPNAITQAVINQIREIIMLVFGVVMVIAFFASAYLAGQFTKPIRYISSLMENFDDDGLKRELVLHTNTELDDIGNSYNNMLERIGALLDQVQYKERELRKAELDTLLYQIQPHFLYNTLDTIYMLARISREKTIMTMIQALSKYLRINLSNGAEEITVEEELEQVKSYMDIQKIRKSDLFDYEITCADGIRNQRVLKMILQPVVENCIKHGFEKEEVQGHIWVSVRETQDDIVFAVENDGAVMDKKICDRMNRLETMDLDVVNSAVTTKKGGYGISNVVRRLRLRYEGNIRFYYVVSAQRTTCIIKIKKETDEQGEND